MHKTESIQTNLPLEQLIPGDIILYPPNSIADGGWVGQAIVYFTKGEVSHSAVYCGKIDSVPMIAHAEPGGISYQSFESLLACEPCCYIRRHTGKLDLAPVMEAVAKYTDKGNSYPFINLGIIGLLILLNKFSKDSIKNRIVYDFALLVGLKIMKQAKERIHPEETPMMCSQFAAQCYTDAGLKYDLKFDKLLLQFGNVPKTEGESSLLETLRPDDKLELPTGLDDSILLREDCIVTDFFNLVKSKDVSKCIEIEDKRDLRSLATLLLSASCRAITGMMPEKVEDAIHALSTNRNYLVTPDDLFANASNLRTVGYMKKLYAQTSFFKFVD